MAKYKAKVLETPINPNSHVKMIEFDNRICYYHYQLINRHYYQRSVSRMTMRSPKKECLRETNTKKLEEIEINETKRNILEKAKRITKSCIRGVIESIPSSSLEAGIACLRGIIYYYKE